MRRAVFLDRDGVLNRAVVRDGKPYPPANPQEVEIASGAVEALRRLHEHGFLLIVVSNQPDIARGLTTPERVAAINAVLTGALPLDDVFICPHDDRDGCHCRKPKPGLILDAAAKHGVDVASSYMIGDLWRDIDAAANAGCTGILIDCEYNDRISAEPAARIACILDAAEWIMEREVS
jgi:D-glycero-D-manno-heptose 1,7-bisphosphate phosphatase